MDVYMVVAVRLVRGYRASVGRGWLVRPYVLAAELRRAEANARRELAGLVGPQLLGQLVRGGGGGR
ncbi:hypothetical protein RIF23_16030 [Lipingzhangella sp. LS1_29]|uniref:Uncharacterized protein n=1 Tax=Lipingzhangella rawalii TaxID=2055835 RepID=A0ABU2H9W7_9ACTN|nr:hypothetical protein [Lipingzhangella rawalii]MDS1271802.1 hypothetical protein [Lipingzhangella rawalii]